MKILIGYDVTIYTGKSELKATGLQGNGTCIDDGTDAPTSAKKMKNASI